MNSLENIFVAVTVALTVWVMDIARSMKTLAPGDV
jgi:hypothetical protein